MIFVADESVDRPIVARLRLDGHDVYEIADAEPSISDDEVLERARERSAVLITADKDFGDLVNRQRLLHTGVILIRFAGASANVKARILATVVREHSSEMPGAFCVVTGTSIRIRREDRLT